MSAQRPDDLSEWPSLLTLPAGDYWWCACGRTATPPFCDGAHAGSADMPIKCRISRPQDKVWLCNCKRSKTAPFCDGSHNKRQI